MEISIEATLAAERIEENRAVVIVSEAIQGALAVATREGVDLSLVIGALFQEALQARLDQGDCPAEVAGETFIAVGDDASAFRVLGYGRA